MTRQRALVLERVLLAFFAAALVVHFVRRAGAPKEFDFFFYSDHYRHLRYAWETWRIGPRIYVATMQEWQPLRGDTRAFGWTDTRYLYPPGALLLFTPVSQLAYRGVISIDTAANIMLALFALAAAWTSVRLWLEGALGTGTFEGAALWFAFGVSLFVPAVAWGLHGQYDPFVAALLVFAATRKSPSSRVLFLALAFFLKFQALLCLPFFARDLFVLVRVQRSRVVRDPRVVIGILLTSVTLGIAVYLAKLGVLSSIKGSPFHFADFPNDRTTVGCVIFTVGFVIVAALRGRFSASVTAAWIFTAFGSLSLIQGWYVVYLYTPALFVERRSQSWIALYTLGLVYMMHWVPDLYRETVMFFVLRP